MASLETRLRDALTRVGTEFKTVYAEIGVLGSLTTSTKSSLVAAINELQAALANATNINDVTPGATTTYSSNKVVGLLAQLKSDLVGGASSAYDTLVEIQAILQGDDASIATITTALGNRVRYDAVQTLTTGQKAQARTNIDAYGSVELGNPDTDFVAVFTAALT